MRIAISIKLLVVFAVRTSRNSMCGPSPDGFDLGAARERIFCVANTDTKLFDTEHS
jgi:hypothetical protein